jgi:hypothetical protein
LPGKIGIERPNQLRKRPFTRQRSSNLIDRSSIAGIIPINQKTVGTKSQRLDWLAGAMIIRNNSVANSRRELGQTIGEPGDFLLARVIRHNHEQDLPMHQPLADQEGEEAAVSAVVLPIRSPP